MKKVVLASVMMVFGIAAQAQTKTDNATLNVKLHPLQTLVINPASDHKTVDLEYFTKENYNDGVSALKQNHLKVFSTGGFEVKVKSSGSELTTTATGGNGNIAASTVRITALPATNDALAEAQYVNGGVALSADDTSILSSTKGAVDKNININYAAAGANAYIDKYVAGQSPTVFTTTVTYTIFAK